jgi:hypothetical protein
MLLHVMPWLAGGRPSQESLQARSGRFGSALLDQTLNGWRGLSAYAEPVGQTVLLNAQTLFATLGDRVVKTDTLDETAIAANAFVSHNDIEKRTVLGTAARESNDDHDLSFGWWEDKIVSPT